MKIIERPRRNRKMESLRSLVEETNLSMKDLVMPCFLLEGNNRIVSIDSMPGVFRYSCDVLLRYLDSFVACGLKGVLLFFIIEDDKKDDIGSVALKDDFWGYHAIRKIKESFPHLCVMGDLALDPFTKHGHDGIVHNGNILNDETLKILSRISLLMSDSGIDLIAPSDMMDGRIGFLRDILDRHHHQNVGILSYTAKYASSFYGPFRDAMGSHPSFGDKKTYQMNPANKREALREAILDQNEGADILLVKPALPYLDVIALLKENSHLPIAAYQVSGEYSMCMAAAEKGWIDSKKVLLESLLSIKRAGADMIFTYAIDNIMEFIS